MAERKKRAGAPLGNQNGVGHGRPPNEGFSNEELVSLGEDLLAWMRNADEEKAEIVHLSEWYSVLKGIRRSQWKSIIQRDCFLPYYERALDWLGVRLLKNKNLPIAYGHRFLAIYFSEIRDHERAVMREKIDYELTQKQAFEQQDPNIVMRELRSGVRAMCAEEAKNKKKAVPSATSPCPR